MSGTVNYNSKEGCQKCCIVGEYSYISNTVVFPVTGRPKRTGELFRNMHYTDHQKVDTPLNKLPIDLIKDVVVADPLHLLELGVMKRLLIGWRTGNLGFQSKWSARQQEEISEQLLKIKMPAEMHRDVRSLKLFANWKGLEFRNFLNYYSVAILEHYLPHKYYEHFLFLFCAVIICSAQKYKRHLNIAHLLFKSFISDYKKLYGVEFITSNVHNLEHVVDDVSRFGILSSISAYPFENSLYTIKKMLRAGKNPLVQIVNRLTERLFVEDFNYTSNNRETRKLPIIHIANGKCTIEFPEFKIGNSIFKDQWFNANKQIICMKNAFEIDSMFFVEGWAVPELNDVFLKPLKSSLINIHKASIENIKQGEIIIVKSSDIDCKLVAIQRANDCVFIPILHTLKHK